MIPKPFDLDELILAVSRAVGQSVPFEVSELAKTERTNQLKAKLEVAGARDIHLSTQREWASFRRSTNALVQIYWSQRDGVYYLMRQAESGGKMEQVGRVHDLDDAIAIGMLVG